MNAFLKISEQEKGQKNALKLRHNIGEAQRKIYF
jgi:hypothetical protein